VSRPLTILQLGTYPIEQPEHGGQRRVAALRRAYRAAGFAADYLAVYSPVSYLPETAARHDILIGPATRARIAASPWREDVFIGECLLHDAECREKFLAFWRRLRPDVVALEQPFLWASLRQLIRDGTVERPLIVHSSQNVEADMKADIYAQVLPPGERAAAVEQVRELEDDLTRHADVLVAVHQSDAERLTRAAPKPCVLLRNGGEVRTATRTARRKWTKLLQGSPRPRRGFFVGSAHPPNSHGFVQMLGPALGYLPPDCEIVVAGGVSRLIRESELCTGPLAGVNESRLRLLGCLPDADLAALIELSHLVLLPITSGGGSNLKTVEALLSGKPVVGTRYAFRAYEDFAACGTVTLADDPAEFKQAVVRQLCAPEGASQPAEGQERLRELTWENLGRAFVAELLARLAEVRRARPLAA
jgi:glycosyltransferase involved in cell wall biosynthesis